MSEQPDSMVERVARVLDPYAFDEANDPALESFRADARIEARAAITAMREPTEVMKTVIVPAYTFDIGGMLCQNLGGDALRNYERMIDAALGGGPFMTHPALTNRETLQQGDDRGMDARRDLERDRQRVEGHEAPELIRLIRTSLTRLNRSALCAILTDVEHELHRRA